MAENDVRDVQDVLDEVDELQDRSLDDLNTKTFITQDLNSESGSQNGLQRICRVSHPREAGDTGKPGKARDSRERASVADARPMSQQFA